MLRNYLAIIHPSDTDFCGPHLFLRLMSSPAMWLTEESLRTWFLRTSGKERRQVLGGMKHEKTYITSNTQISRSFAWGKWLYLWIYTYVCLKRFFMGVDLMIHCRFVNMSWLIFRTCMPLSHCRNPPTNCMAKRGEWNQQGVSHRIHVWYIYLHFPIKFTIHVGEYTSPMDPMGYKSQLFHELLDVEFIHQADHAQEFWSESTVVQVDPDWIEESHFLWLKNGKTSRQLMLVYQRVYITYTHGDSNGASKKRPYKVDPC